MMSVTSSVTSRDAGLLHLLTTFLVLKDIIIIIMMHGASFFGASTLTLCCNNVLLILIHPFQSIDINAIMISGRIKSLSLLECTNMVAVQLFVSPR